MLHRLGRAWFAENMKIIGLFILTPCVMWKDLRKMVLILLSMVFFMGIHGKLGRISIKILSAKYQPLMFNVGNSPTSLPQIDNYLVSSRWTKNMLGVGLEDWDEIRKRDQIFLKGTKWRNIAVRGDFDSKTKIIKSGTLFILIMCTINRNFSFL